MRPAQLAKQLGDCATALRRLGYADVARGLANSTGPVVDHLFASLTKRVGLSDPFFREGWGDLSVVDFHQDAAVLLGQWPPPHFRVEVRPRLCRAGEAPGPAILRPRDCVLDRHQVQWEKKQEGVHRKVPYQVLEGTFQ